VARDRESVDFGQGSGRASRVVFGIGRCGGCGEGGGVALRVAMVDGVERERLRKGRPLRAMSGGVVGGRVRPRWEGRKYLLCEGFGSDSVTGDVLRKKYIMLTKFYYDYVRT
jgi:hypothetical protein